MAKGIKKIEFKDLNHFDVAGCSVTKSNKPPKVVIAEMTIDQNHFNDGNHRWSVLKLIEHSKQFKVFDMPLAGINLSGCPWGDKMDIDSFIHHCHRMENTSLEHPIILDDTGSIADGWHRIVKAILKGKRTIKAIRLESMPEYDVKLNHDNQ